MSFNNNTMNTNSEIINIETAEDGFIYCARAVTTDGVKQIHRYTLPPNTDLNTLEDDVREAVENVCVNTWTTDTVQRFNSLT